MSLINKLLFRPINTTQEPQPETTPQPQATQRVATGIASTPDAFETSVPLNSIDLFTQQPPPPDSRLNEMLKRLDSLKEKKREIKTELQDQQKQSLETQQALSAIEESLNSDKPIPDAILPLLGSLGVLGIIGGLPALPIIGGLGILGGLTGKYKQKMQEAKAELERKAGEDIEPRKEELKSELADVDSQTETTLRLIEKEKLRLEEQARRAQSRDPLSTRTIVVEEPWKEFSLDQNQTQQENIPWSFGFKSILQKKDDKLS